MKKILVFLFTMSLGLCFSLADVMSVKAQETGSDEFTLEEITVTAQKREQDLQKVASGIEVIQGYQLTEMGSLDLDDALRNISSALVSPAGEEMTVIIRGMDNDSMPGDSYSQVAVTVDGSFSNSWGVGTTGLYDMQRIEVLAGPQGTLYSRNSAGGVVNMISNSPTTEEVQASGSVELGNYARVNMTGMLNVPLSDAWAVRAAFISSVNDGYASNGLNDTDDRSLRLKLGFTPSDNLSAVFTYEYNKIGGKSQGNGFEAFEDESDVDDPWTNLSDGDLFHGWTQTSRYYMNLDLKTPIGTVTFLPSFSDTGRKLTQAGWVTDDPAFGMGGRGNRLYEAGETFNSPQDEQSYELRMASPDDFFMKFIVGLYYYEREWRDKITHKDIWYFTDNGDDSDDFYLPSTEDTTSWGSKGGNSKAVFGSFTFPVTNAFRVNAGGRYTKEKETSSGVDRMTGEPTYNEMESGHPDHKLGAEYDIGEDTMLWVDYSTGYKLVRGGGSRGADQKTTAYQAGSKSRFLDNKLQFNATAFYYDYSNFSVGQGIDPVYVVIDGETITYNGSGIGDAVIYGLDVSTDYVITSADRLNFSLSYLSAEVDQVLVTYTYQGIENTELAPPKTIPSGKKLNNSPEMSVVAGYQHRFDLVGGGKITPNISVRYTSEYFLEFEVNERNIPAGMDPDKVNTEPATIMADASLNYSHGSGKWSLNGYVKNITNHAQKNGMMRGDMRLGPPRTYGAVLSVNF
ncbi:MAG: TonB-dependent receptor [Deltaproteobacteria bacterium]|nr:TonB-dependent receptor [Deltaproteobacteria bacterium]